MTIIKINLLQKIFLKNIAYIINFLIRLRIIGTLLGSIVNYNNKYELNLPLIGLSRLSAYLLFKILFLFRV